MICGRCGFDRWDGESTHEFAGRPSAGVKCWGPKVKQQYRVTALTTGAVMTTGDAVVEPEPVKELGPSKAAMKAELFARALDDIAIDLKLKRGTELSTPKPEDRRGRRIKRKPLRKSRK